MKLHRDGDLTNAFAYLSENMKVASASYTARAKITNYEKHASVTFSQWVEQVVEGVAVTMIRVASFPTEVLARFESDAPRPSAKP